MTDGLRRAVGRGLGVLALLVGLGGGGSPATAALVEPLGLDQLVARSTTVVRGRVLEAYSGWDGRRIFTHTRIQVAEVHKAPAQGAPLAQQPLEVITPGGVVGDIGQLVHGTPRFVPGEDVLLFLEPVRLGWTPVALALGKFRIQPGEGGLLLAVRELSGLEFAAPAPLEGTGAGRDAGAGSGAGGVDGGSGVGDGGGAVVPDDRPPAGRPGSLALPDAIPLTTILEALRRVSN